jgi:hypothetical protein
MKASDYMNNKQNVRTQQNNSISPKKRAFTWEYFINIIKTIAGLVSLYLIIMFIKWGAQFYVDHKYDFQNIRVTLNQSQIDTAITKIIGKDTISVPITYRYEDIEFESNDTTYWFVKYRAYGEKDYYKGGSTRVILPTSFFDFNKAAEFIVRKDNKVNEVFIENFIQISKASYISYEKYADKW